MSKQQAPKQPSLWEQFYNHIFNQDSDVAFFIETYFREIRDELVELCEDNEVMKERIISYFKGE